MTQIWRHLSHALIKWLLRLRLGDSACAKVVHLMRLLIHAGKVTAAEKVLLLSRLLKTGQLTIHFDRLFD